MQPSKPAQGVLFSAANALLSVGPTLVVLAWFAAGQWESAGPEPRAWLQFAGTLWVASLLPLPGRSVSLRIVLDRLNWWGWLVVVGLLVAT